MTRSILLLKRDFTAIGGAEKYARQMAHALHEKGARVTVLTSGPTIEAFPFEVISVPRQTGSSLQKILRFDRFAESHRKAQKPDLVLGLERNSYQTHLRASSGTHRAYLAHRKSEEPLWKSFRHQINPLHRLLLHIEKKGFENPALETLFTNSHLVKREILSHYNVAEEKISVIHNGVEWAAWQTSFDRWPTNSSKERYEFLFVGHNFKRKGLDRLLQGLAQLKGTDFHLSVVGEDKERDRYEHLAQTLGLNVTFHGSQNEVCPFYQKADCLVIPSLYDPFANVTIEALAMGLFVISSKTNGGSEILTSQNGTLIEDLSSPEAMAQALRIALKHPKTLESAQETRHGVKSMDFSLQLGEYLKKLL